MWRKFPINHPKVLHAFPETTTAKTDQPPCSRYLLISIVADIQRVSVLVHLLRPATWRRAILTVWLARVRAEAGVLRRQRLESTDGEREEGKERRRERERSGLWLEKKEREEKREGIFFTVELQRRGDSHAPTASKSSEIKHHFDTVKTTRRPKRAKNHWSSCLILDSVTVTDFCL